MRRCQKPFVLSFSRWNHNFVQTTDIGNLGSTANSWRDLNNKAEPFLTPPFEFILGMLIINSDAMVKCYEMVLFFRWHLNHYYADYVCGHIPFFDLYCFVGQTLFFDPCLIFFQPHQRICHSAFFRFPIEIPHYLLREDAASHNSSGYLPFI